MIINEDELKTAKWSELVSVKCDNCDKVHKRTKRSILNKSNINNQYCNNSCQGQHKRKIIRNKILDAGEKKCGLCKKMKSLEEYNKNKGTPDGYNRVCRICGKKSSKKYYSENTQLHKKNVNERNNKIYREQRKKLNELLNDSDGCIDCTNGDVRVLEFDHKDECEKFKNISKMIGNYKWNRILEEIKKCDIRCANCHRIRTSKQFNWYKF